MSKPAIQIVAIWVLALAPPIQAQDSAKVNKLLSRDPTAAISAARTFLEDEEVTKIERAKLTHLWGRALTMTQDFEGAFSKLEEAKKLALDAGDQRLLTRILQAEAVVSCESEDYHRGADVARTGIQIAESTGDQLLVGILHMELGANLCALSDYEGAISALNTALDFGRKLNNPKLQATALGNLASIYDELEKFARATQLHRAALQFFEESNNGFLIATTKVNLANSLLSQEMIDQAEPLFRETVVLAKKLGLLNVLALAHVGCGDVALHRSQIEQAETEYDLARECWKQLGDPNATLVLAERSARLAQLRNPPSANKVLVLEELEAALPTALAAGNTKQSIAIAEALIAEYESRSQWPEALQLTEQVADLKQEIWSRESAILLGEAESRVLVLQKEKQIQELRHTNQVQKLELRNQARTRTLYVVALGLSCVVMAVMWRSSLLRRNAYQKLQHAHAELRQQEQRQLELERTLADQNKTESLRIMAGGIAHDFNNLMTGVLGEAEAGRIETEASEKNEHFEQIVEVALRASDLTSQLVSFAGRSVSQSRNFDLLTTLTSTTGLLKSIATPVAELKLQLVDKELPVIGDETQIRQVLVNLVKNAAEAMEDSGEITISSGRKYLEESDLSSMPLGRENSEGEYCFCQVTDHGKGLEPSLANKIFDPFFSTKFVGRGLGLASVMGIIRAHRGAISVESQVNVGTSITIYLPIASPEEVSSAAIPLPQARFTHGSVPERIGVMFVEDDPLVRKSTTNILGASGFDVFAAESAEEALEVADRNRDQIHVAVIDYAMAGKNGVWLAEQLRARAPEMKRILCSGYTEDTIRKTELFLAFLHKPYTAADLVGLLHRSVGPQGHVQREKLKAGGPS